MTSLQKRLFIVFTILLFLVLIFFKSRQGVVLFGDFNFALFKENKFLDNFYIWDVNNFSSFGSYGVMYASTYPLFIFKILSHLLSVNIISTIYFYGLYFGIFISSLYLLNKINQKAQLIDYLIVGGFSIANPLVFSLHGQTDMAYSLIGVNFIIGYAFQCYFRRVFGYKEMFVLSIISLFVIIYLQTFMLLVGVILLFGLAHAIFKKGKINWKKMLFFFLIFVGVHSFWLIHIVYLVFTATGINNSIGYEPNNDGLSIVNVMSNTIKYFSPLIVSSAYITDPKDILSYYARWYSILASFSILIFIIWSTLINYSKHNVLRWRKIIIGCFCTIIIFYIFSLGTNDNFRELFLLFWNHIPLFNLYRSIHKFIFLIYFSMLILLSISLSACKSRTVKIAILLSVLILFSAFFQKRFLQIINNYPIPGYYNSIHRDYNPPLISSIKILPDTNWYTKFEWNPNHTDSVNVLHYYLKQNSFYNTPTYSLTVSFSYYINNYISDYMLSCQKPQEAEIGKLLGLFNIKNVMFQQDNVFKDYKRYCPERLSQQNYLTKKQTIGAIDIYVNDPINFLQKIYSPADIIISDKKITDLVNIVSEKDYSPQSAIFFEQDNQAEAISDIQNIVDHKDPSSPVIEYKKINPTKYKLIVHGAKASFPLVFSESFHSGWKAYVKPTRDTVAQSEESLIDKTKNYYVHQNNKEDQATREELAGFIDIGLISNLGEKQSPDFVSKIFSGTIQNDNMDDGSVSETWFRQPVEEKYHLKANGYANSWIIDPIKICSESNKCIKNPDGSYDIEIVIDFWPQRLLYLGSFISGSTIFGFMIYIIYNWRKNKMVKTRISVIKKKNA